MIRGSDPRGEVFRCGRAMCINNARIENVSLNRDGRTGTMTISYVSRRRDDLYVISTLILVIGRESVLVNQSGSPVCLCDVRPGMWADVQFSRAMTFSIPPRANAIRVVVRQQRRPSQPRPPRPEQPRPPVQNRVTTTRVVSVDPRGNRLVTGIPFNVNRQLVFTVSNETRILDRQNRPIRLSDIRPGQRVRVTHAAFQTMSIPPQSPAYEIRVL